MERLTEKDAYWIGEEFWTSAKEPDDEEIDNVYFKLKEYEDLEEQGLLLKLPCKAGDRFWELNSVNDVPHIYPRLAHSLSHCVYVMERLGTTVFLTKSEAEAALAEMEK